MRFMQGVLVASLATLAAITAGCGGRARLEMGGLTEANVEPMAVNAAVMNCELRRGFLKIALRCPGIVYPESTVDMVIYANGRVECIAPRDQEDDCPVVAEALLSTH